MAPTAVDSGDDARLQALMEQRERENAEVSGDEDSEDGGSDSGNVAAGAATAAAAADGGGGGGGLGSAP